MEQSKTLLDIVREHGWPSGAKYCVQNQNRLVIFGAGTKPPKYLADVIPSRWTNYGQWNYSVDEDFTSPHLASDYSTKILTVEEFMNSPKKSNTVNRVVMVDDVRSEGPYKYSSEEELQAILSMFLADGLVGELHIFHIDDNIRMKYGLSLK